MNEGNKEITTEQQKEALNESDKKKSEEENQKNEGNSTQEETDANNNVTCDKEKKDEELKENVENTEKNDKQEDDEHNKNKNENEVNKNENEENIEKTDNDETNENNKTEEEEEEQQQQQTASESKVNVYTLGDEAEEEEEYDDGNDQERIDKLAKRILSGEQDPLFMKAADVIPIISSLTVYRNEKLAEHDADEAEKADFFLTKIIDNYKNVIKCAVQQQHQKDVVMRLEKAEVKLTQIEKQAQESMRSLKEENQKLLTKLKERQSVEMDQLIKKFSSPIVQRQYTQASQNLRTLRTQTALLRQAKRFDELRYAEHKVQLQEKHESYEAHRSMTIELERQMKLLDDKHRTEYQHYLIANEDRETTLKIVCDRKIDAIKRHIENIVIDLKQLQYTEQVWNLHHRGEIIPIGRAPTPKKCSLKTRSSAKPNIFGLKLPPLMPPKKKTLNTRLSSTSYKV